jgi:hypothetical protein
MSNLGILEILRDNQEFSRPIIEALKKRNEGDYWRKKKFNKRPRGVVRIVSKYGKILKRCNDCMKFKPDTREFFYTARITTCISCGKKKRDKKHVQKKI